MEQSETFTLIIKQTNRFIENIQISQTDKKMQFSCILLKLFFFGFFQGIIAYYIINLTQSLLDKPSK